MLTAVGLSTSPFLATSNFGTFIFFGCITTIAAIWVYFFVPETKGKTLEEMDELFGSGEAAFARRDADLKHSIERELGLLALLGEEEPGQDVIFTAEKSKTVNDGDQEQVEKKSLGD